MIFNTFFNRKKEKTNDLSSSTNLSSLNNGTDISKKFATSTSDKLRTSQFSSLRNFPNCFSEKEWELYSSLKNALPIVDAAITKIIRLVGEFKIECGNKKYQNDINDFLENLKVDAISVGINSFIFCYLNQLLTFGTSVGEMIVDKNEIIALYNVPLRDVEVATNKNKLDVDIYKRMNTKDGIKLQQIKFKDFVFVSVLNPEAGKIYGNSILKGLPYLSSILLKIYEVISLNWERIGNTKFVINYNPPQSDFVQNITKEQIQSIAEQWSKCMNSNTSSDFIAIGDLNVKAIGADIQVIDSRIPVRQLLEQILSKLSIPPFLLGLSWSTTETMSEQQADILSGELQSYRRILNPVIKKICSCYFKLKNLNENFNIVWNPINLKDKLRAAQANFLDARTSVLINKNLNNNTEK